MINILKQIILLIILILFFNLIIYLKDKNPNNILYLVNKDNKIINYIPNNLVLIDKEYGVNKYLRKEALNAFIKLHNDAKKLNYNIKITSAYRDYEYQKKLFEYYKKYYGYNYAINCSSKPGYSEHHTGLAIDVMGSNNNYNNFIESKEYNWMINNCYKYGFILRYPKGKENITYIKFEPWHYRYVGIKVATYIHKNNLTLEEYKKIHKRIF